jgi:hypothetical protein
MLDGKADKILAETEHGENNRKIEDAPIIYCPLDGEKRGNLSMRKIALWSLVSLAIMLSVSSNAASLLENAKAETSVTYPSTKVANLVDCDEKSAWNSGSFAPASVFIEMANSKPISFIRLIPNQTPAGKTTHEILVSDGGNSFRLVDEILEEFTRDGVPIIRTFDPPLKSVKKIWIITRKSPSWVAWYEIQAYSSIKEMESGCKKRIQNN